MREGQEEGNEGVLKHLLTVTFMNETRIASTIPTDLEVTKQWWRVHLLQCLGLLQSLQV